MTSLPKDPKGTGISSSSAGECITAGSSYAYYTDPSGSLYAITSTKESKKGNASACGDTIDKNNDGNFQKVGQGLKINISYTTNNRYNPATDGDPVERCLLHLTQADTDELNTTLNSTRTKEQWCSLTSLYINYNSSLTSIPESIGNLAALTDLRIGDNSSLTSIPESIGNLAALTILVIGDNSSLTSIPQSIGNL